MPSLSTRRHAWAVAVLVLTSAIAGDAVQSRLPCGGGNVFQMLQFAENKLLVMRIAPAGSSLNAAAIEAQRLDTRLFIPIYWLLFASAGLLFARTGKNPDRLAGIGIIAAASGAAWSDLQENRLILAALANADDFRSPINWAMAKWALVFAATLGLSLPPLLRVKRPHQSRVLAVVAGILLLAGSVIGLNVLRGPEWLGAAVALAAIGLLLMALSFIWNPEYLFETAS